MGLRIKALLVVFIVSCLSAIADPKDSHKKVNSASKDLVIELKAGEGAYVIRKGSSSTLTTLQPIAIKKMEVIASFAPQEVDRVVSVRLPPNSNTSTHTEISENNPRILKYRGWLAKLAKIDSIATVTKSLNLKGRRINYPNHIKEDIKTRAKQLEQTALGLNSKSRVTKVFSTSVAAVKVEGLSETDLKQLKEQKIISSYQPNFLVQAELFESLPLLHTAEAWQASGTQGQGISIGIIDSGIDYTHEAFGSCTNAQYLAGNCVKVKPGYDFIDNDEDPADCNGHGTHVASIAAGSGLLQGMAPQANLVPIRVIDCDGYGTFDSVLAGIEWSIDPNGDGDLSDHLQVINLSLGGFGDPDDILSQAIDAASAAGVVPVIAAGNYGGDFKIQSPGTARSAITVGAVSRDSTLAYFSSRGPVYWETDQDGFTLMKPDVVAPGNPVCAARHGDSFAGNECLDDQHVALSGTSMATPHVAGLAAVIRAQHPLWNPNQVKAAIKQSARHLTDTSSLHSQGAGLIDALNSVELESPIEVTLHQIPYTRSRYISFSSDVTVSENASVTFSYASVPNIGTPREEDWIRVSQHQVLTGHASVESSLLDLISLDGSPKYIRVEVLTESQQRSVDYGIIYYQLFSVKSPREGLVFNPSSPLRFDIEHSADINPTAATVEYQNAYLFDPNLPWTTTSARFENISPTLTRLTVPSFQFESGVRALLRFTMVVDGQRNTSLKLITDFDESLYPGFPVDLHLSPVTLIPGLVGYWHPGNLKPLVGNLLGKETQLAVYIGGDPARVDVYTKKGRLISSFVPGPGLHVPADLSYDPVLFNADSDPQLEIALFSPDGDNRSRWIHVMNFDGTEVSGWPKLIGDNITDPVDNIAISAAKLPNESKPVLVVSTRSGRKTYIYRANGQLIRTFETGPDSCRSGNHTWFTITSYPHSMPNVSDVTGDCYPELITYANYIDCSIVDPNPHYTRKISTFDIHSGELLREWSLPTQATYYDSLFDSIIVGDFQRNNTSEFLVPDSRSPNYLGISSLYLYSNTGEILPGWPVELGILLRLALAPVAFTEDGAFKFAASLIGFTSDLTNYLINTEIINRNGVVDTEIINGQLSGSPLEFKNEPRAIPLNGTKPGLAISMSDALAGVGSSGERIPGFPKVIPSTQSTSRDIDGDGLLEIISNGPSWHNEGIITLNAFRTKGKGKAQWGEARHDPMLTGVLASERPSTCSRLR